MTEEQINERITEITGLWDHPYSSDTRRMMDFCNDLNATHEAEKVLTKEQVREYQNYMYDMACEIDNTYGRWMPYSATARYRAEAFLKTMGKWEEAK